jgi:pimeloyl-ACP methyl ester carboxylesterase/DNA-binding winged helix-turn-helix (wHTH) protein
MRFTFGQFVLDSQERSLRDDDGLLPLTPKAFDTLVLLVQNAGKILSKERLMSEVWQDAFVEENNLAQNISILRKVLRESREQKYIETVPKFGYRFVAEVDSDGASSVPEDVVETFRGRVYLSDSDADQPLPDHPQKFVAPLRPATNYVQNGDVDIAYQVLGEGPVDIVFVMGWVSHLEYFWKHHLFASFLERLASFSRLILFDKRGTGLSDRVPNDRLPTLEQRMEDVHAVMDAVGSERAVLVGVSEGGPMCALFAATYPERTSGLVMFGTYAKRIRDIDYPWAPTIEQRNAFLDVVKRDWGKPVGIEERAPSMAGDPEFRDWWAEYLRMGASPGAAVALTKMNAEIDVRDVLPLVRVPTLIMHRRDDICLKVDEGRYVAERIPEAKFVELEGNDHLPFVGDQERVVAEIREFVDGLQYGGGIDRVLATVLNIRLVDIESFRQDPDLAARTREFIRRKLDLYRGREVQYDDGQVLATFDGPARAIRCAASIVESADGQEIAVKTGLHTGECDVVGDRYSGFAVELAKLIAAESEPGNILVSRTVKDLVAGSGLEFAEFGTRQFDIADGEWRLFEVVI